MKCSHIVSAEAQARFDAAESITHDVEHEIIAGLNARAAELLANQGLNESDLAAMPPGWPKPKNVLDIVRALPGLSHL
jgi:hypothetical protein